MLDLWPLHKAREILHAIVAVSVSPPQKKNVAQVASDSTSAGKKINCMQQYQRSDILCNSYIACNFACSVIPCVTVSVVRYCSAGNIEVGQIEQIYSRRK